MKLSKREKLLIGLLAVIALIYMISNFYSKPRLAEITRLSNENKAMKAQLNQGANKKDKATLETESDRIKQNYIELLTAIPSNPGIPETMAFVQNSARDAGLYLISIKYAPVNKSGDQAKGLEGQENKQTTVTANKANEIKYNVSVRGSYNNLMSFMLKMENSPRLYTVRICKMAAATRKVEEPQTLPAVPEVKDGPTAAPAAASAPTPTIKGSALYDGGSITLDLEFSAFYYNDVLKIETNTDEVVPPGEGSIDPFNQTVKKGE